MTLRRTPRYSYRTNWSVIYRFSWGMLWLLAAIGVFCVFYPRIQWHMKLKRDPSLQAYVELTKQYERDLGYIMEQFTAVATEAARKQISESKQRLVSEIGSLSDEKENLRHALATDKESLAAILQVQEEIRRGRRMWEHCISFLLGVLSSVIATGLVAARHYLKKSGREKPSRTLDRNPRSN